MNAIIVALKLDVEIIREVASPLGHKLKKYLAWLGQRILYLTKMQGPVGGLNGGEKNVRCVQTTMGVLSLEPKSFVDRV